MTKSSSGSDDEAPEALSFNSSKKRARQDEDDLRAFQTEEKRKKKEKNRVRDKSLKERAARSDPKARGKEKQPKEDEDEDEDAESGDRLPRDDLEGRMERAMREAQEEESGSDSQGEGAEEAFLLGHDTESEEEHSSGGGSEDEAGGQESDSDSQRPEVKKATSKWVPKTPNYLPDHLFASAFADSSSSSPRSTSKRKQVTDDEPPQKSKKRRTKKQSKDIVVGSRTIRTLSTTQGLNGHSPIPSAESQQPKTVSKFLKRTLNLSGSAAVAKNRGWERRPAHIGVLKRNGPAANFVRGS